MQRTSVLPWPARAKQCFGISTRPMHESQTHKRKAGRDGWPPRGLFLIPLVLKEICLQDSDCNGFGLQMPLEKGLPRGRPQKTRMRFRKRTECCKGWVPLRAPHTERFRKHSQKHPLRFSGYLHPAVKLHGNRTGVSRQLSVSPERWVDRGVLVLPDPTGGGGVSANLRTEALSGGRRGT